jgi:hypothetical protein
MPTADEMASAGFTPEDYETEPVEVWPENWPAWSLWCDVSGQWRQSMNGPTALDYTPLFMRMDRLALPADEWERRFADIRHIEAAALTQMRKGQPAP